jgi:hypothetical protein
LFSTVSQKTLQFISGHAFVTRCSTDITLTRIAVQVDGFLIAAGIWNKERQDPFTLQLIDMRFGVDDSVEFLSAAQGCQESILNPVKRRRINAVTSSWPLFSDTPNTSQPPWVLAKALTGLHLGDFSELCT